MSRGGLGLVAITDPANTVLGIFHRRRPLAAPSKTHRPAAGRHRLGHARESPHHQPRPPLAVEAVEMMERLRINALLVVDTDNHLIGALNMHDLFTAKVI